MRFENEELRVAKTADARAKASRYLHVQCRPGGFHPQDTFSGPAASSPGLQGIVASFVERSPQPPEPALDPRALPGLPALAGDSWWEAWQWESAFEVTCGTLIDVPPSVEVAYALAKDEIVQSCLEAG